MRSRWLAAIAVLVLSTGVLAADLPRETAILVEIDDIEGTLASLDGSPAARKALGDVAGDFRKKLETQVEGARRILGFSLGDRDEILALPERLRGRVSVALLPGEGAKPAWLLRYVARTEAESDAIRSAVAILEAAVLRADPASRIALEEEVSVLRGAEDEARLGWSFRGRTLVASASPSLVRRALEEVGDSPWTAPLERAVGAARCGPGLRAWASVDALSRMGEGGAFDEGFRNLVRLLDALGVRSVAAAAGLTADGPRSAIHLAAPGDAPVVRMVSGSGRAPWPGRGPEGTLFSLALGSAPQDLLAAWLELTLRLDPGAFARTQAGLENLLLGLGIDAREDILAKLGDGVLVHFVQTRHGPQPLASAPLRDREGLLEVVGTLGEAAGWRRTEREDGVLWITTDGTPTGFLVREDRLYTGRLEALAALSNGERSERPIREDLPGAARALLIADGKALPGWARWLAEVTLALVPADGGVTIVVAGYDSSTSATSGR